MAEDPPLPPPMRLMNFVSQEQLEEAKRSRGERVEDGTAQRDRPLYEILKENKDKRDAEFNERFKYRPPKALDEDETEFLDKLKMSRKEYERQIADEEIQQLQIFQAAVAEQSRIIYEFKSAPAVSNVQHETESVGKKDQPVRPLGKKDQPVRPPGMIIKVKLPAKKTKVDPSLGQPSGTVDQTSAQVRKCSSPEKTCNNGEKPESLEACDGNGANICNVAKTGLVSYSDESDDD